MGETKRELKRAARSDWTQRLARWGLVSKGGLYLLVGLIAMNVSIGGGDRRSSGSAPSITSPGESSSG